jgi:hypothetical protein
MIAPRKMSKMSRASALAAVAPFDYFLLVSLKLSLESVVEFYKLAGSVLSSIQGDQGLKLIAAGESPPRTELFHVWSLSSPNDLREAMVRLADNPAYGKLDDLILDERQEIVTPFGLIPAVRPLVPKGKKYLEITGHLESDDLAEFQAQNETSAPALKEIGWELWGTFLNLTGRLNTVTSLWALGPSKGLAGGEFRNLPGTSLLNDVSVNQWTATSYQPA